MSPPAPANAEPQSSAPPDWNNVPFAVTCARCGHDLHGQTEPKCPACSLGFDWRDACPIEQLKCGKCGYHLYGLRETRCPECGEWFDWRLVLLDYRRRQKDLFEYRWRDRPVGSVFRTWRRALRPRRFWRSIDIYDPPQVKPLLFLIAATAAMAVALVPISNMVISVVAYVLYAIQAAVVNPPFGGFTPRGGYSRFIWNTLQMPEFSTLMTIAAWWAATFASLLILQQSMHRFRIRNEHVLRVWVYGMTCMFVPASLLFFAVSMCVSIFAVLDTPTAPSSIRLLMAILWLAWYFLPTCLAVGVFLHAMWSIRCGYSFYLRMPHGWGVAIASQLIAALSATIAAFWTGSGILWDLFF